MQRHASGTQGLPELQGCRVSAANNQAAVLAIKSVRRRQLCQRGKNFFPDTLGNVAGCT